MPADEEPLGGSWELVEGPADGPTTPAQAAELAAPSGVVSLMPSAPHKPQAWKEPTGGEALLARVVYCVLALLDAAAKMSEAAQQVARRVCAAGTRLLRRVEVAARPMVAATRAAALEHVQLLRARGVHGTAALVAAHAAEIGARAAEAARSALAALCRAVRELASSTPHAARATAHNLQRRTVSTRRRVRATVRAGDAWLRDRCAAADPAGRLPAAARCAYLHAARLPPGTVMLVAGGGLAGAVIALGLAIRAL